jgi:hypothetical protein
MILLLSLLLQCVNATPLKMTELHQIGKDYKVSSSLLTQLVSASSRKVMPDAVAFGIMGRCQYGIGACAGTQTNVSYQNGKLVTSTYVLIGGELGIAEYTNVETYVALCYGNCMEEAAEGVFYTLDAGMSLGAGGIGFVEYGYDPKGGSIFYVGAALSAGQGGGISAGIIYYYLMRPDPNRKETAPFNYDDMRGPKY